MNCYPVNTVIHLQVELDNYFIRLLDSGIWPFIPASKKKMESTLEVDSIFFSWTGKAPILILR